MKEAAAMFRRKCKTALYFFLVRIQNKATYIASDR
jgi:hypothetical protein